MSEKNIPEEDQSQACSCVTDSFTSLPPELQPKEKTWKSRFRQVTCPGCKKEYWTNCEDEFCSACQRNKDSQN